ncbi:MAG: hypothetical protein WA960_15190 [Tunicatimonas sp.]
MKTLPTILVLSFALNTVLSQESYSQPISKVKKQFDEVLKEKDIYNGFFLIHSDQLGIHEQ